MLGREVLGVPCAAPLDLNASLIAEAVRRVTDDFQFVGLTEQWYVLLLLTYSREPEPQLLLY